MAGPYLAKAFSVFRLIGIRVGESLSGFLGYAYLKVLLLMLSVLEDIGVMVWI